ncbi:hypothetical protein HDU83_000686 [Entophlyctis luteolus]|nr:hypothetical protein HDU83_000686 [Entophlyctis luteolus]
MDERRLTVSCDPVNARGPDCPESPQPNNLRTKLETYSLLFTVVTILFFGLESTVTFQSYLEAPLIITLVFGIPHGAIDHILYYQIFLESQMCSTEEVSSSMAPSFSWEDLSRSKSVSKLKTKLSVGLFYFNYFVLMMIWAASWAKAPLVTFWGFLVVSAYHFGEGDLHHLRESMVLPSMIVGFSRGLLLIGSLVTARPAITFPIISKVIGMENPTTLFPHAEIIRFVAVIQNLAIQTFHVLWYLNHLSVAAKWVKELGKSAMFAILFNSVNPLIAFAVYFGLWHSLGSIADEIMFLKRRGNPLFSSSAPPAQQGCASALTVNDFIQFYKSAMPYTLVSVLGMAAFLAFDIVRMHAGSPETVHSLLFEVSETTLWMVFIVSISIITGPHMWVMNLVSRHWKPRENVIEVEAMDPLGLDWLAKDWIVGGGWWWFTTNVH